MIGLQMLLGPHQSGSGNPKQQLLKQDVCPGVRLLRRCTAEGLNKTSNPDTPWNGGTAQDRGANSAVEFGRQRRKIISAILAISPDIAGLTEVNTTPSSFHPPLTPSRLHPRPPGPRP